MIIAKIIATPKVTSFLITDSKDKSILKLNEPVIMKQINKNINAKEIIRIMLPSFFLTSKNNILFNLSGIIDSVWNINVTMNKIMNVVKF